MSNLYYICMYVGLSKRYKVVKNFTHRRKLHRSVGRCDHHSIACQLVKDNQLLLIRQEINFVEN